MITDRKKLPRLNRCLLTLAFVVFFFVGQDLWPAQNLAVSAFNNIRGTQKGLAIGIVNYDHFVFAPYFLENQSHLLFPKTSIGRSLFLTAARNS